MYVFSLADIMPALPEIILSGVALLLVLVAAYGGESAKNARRVTRLALGGILLALVLVINSDPALSSAFGGMFSADSFAVFMKVLVLIGTFAALSMSIRTSGDADINKPEYSLLVLLAMIGMMSLFAAATKEGSVPFFDHLI